MAPVRGPGWFGWVGVSLLAGLGGCRSEPLAVVVITSNIADEWRENALTADVRMDADQVWLSACRTMSAASATILDVDEAHRAIQTRVDNAVVVVHVMQWDVDETRIYVEAQKYMLHSPEVAQLVMERIVSDLRILKDPG